MQVLQWIARKRANLDDLGLQPAELEKLRRQAPEFELDSDGVLLRRMQASTPTPMGAPCSVSVLPAGGHIPRELGPTEWTWRQWALFSAHSSLPGGHLRLEKALPRLASCAWWEGMAKDLQQWIAGCLACLKDRML